MPPLLPGSQELRTSTWRIAILGLAMGGESLEAAEHDMRNVRLWDGGLWLSLGSREAGQ